MAGLSFRIVASLLEDLCVWVQAALVIVSADDWLLRDTNIHSRLNTIAIVLTDKKAVSRSRANSQHHNITNAEARTYIVVSISHKELGPTLKRSDL
jgi:predicted neuraminidase